jgi:hypothetical protein
VSSPNRGDELPARPRPREEIASVVLDGEMVLYDSASQTLHHLNATATLVWLHCDGQQTIEMISRAIADDSDADVEAVRRDVVVLVRELVDAALLVSDSDAS